MSKWFAINGWTTFTQNAENSVVSWRKTCGKPCHAQHVSLWSGHLQLWSQRPCCLVDVFPCGYGSIPIHTIFSGMNIHLPAILMFTRGTRFWPTAMCSHIFILFPWFCQWFPIFSLKFIHWTHHLPIEARRLKSWGSRLLWRWETQETKMEPLKIHL